MEPIRTESAEQTEAVAAELAAELGPGDVVLIAGELGAGKTTFVRGACRALGIDEPVTSPTFTIGRRYAGAVPVSHLDLYRLDSLDAEEPGLLDDYIDAATLTFIEWPDLAERELDLATVRVRVAHAGGDHRTIEVTR